MEIPFKVVCLNDSDRPETIPTTKWIKRGDTYTVVRMDYMNMQKRVLGFQLAEVDLSDCFPYTYFGAWRFGIPISPESMVEVNSEVKEEELIPA